MSAYLLSYSRAIEYPLATQAMGPLKGKKVLDIGGADCPIGLDWSMLGAEVTTIDPAETVGNLRSHPACEALPMSRRPNLVRADGCFLPFRDASFDVVVSISTLEHIPGDGDVRAMEEVCRVLRPEGRVVVTVEGDGSFSEKWYDINAVGIQYESIDETDRRLAAADRGTFVRKYDLDAIEQRLLAPKQLSKVDSGFYDDVLFAGRSWIDGRDHPWMKKVFRHACPLVAQLSYRRLVPGRKPTTSAIGFLVAEKKK